jgi:fucose permease
VNASTTETQPHLLVPLYPAQFFAGVVLIALGPMLNSILRDLHISLAQGGIISLGFAAGRLLGVLALNFALAHVPVKWALVGSAWVQAIGLAAAGLLAHGLWSLFIMYTVVGVAGVLPSLIPGMWVGSHVRQNTARSLLLVQFFVAVGVVITPPVIGVALGWGANWRWIFIGEAAFAVLMALVQTALPLADIPSRQNLRFRQLREVTGYAPRLLAVILLATFLYVGVESTMGVWLAKFEADSFGASATWAALAVTLFWAGIMIGRYLTVPLTHHFRPSQLLAAFAAVLAVFAVAVGMSPVLAVCQVSAFVCGLGASAIFALLAGYSSKFPGWYSSVVYSAAMAAAMAGSMLFPYITGPLAATLGFRAAMSLEAVPAVVVLGLSFSLRRLVGEPRTVRLTPTHINATPDRPARRV